MWSLWEIVAIVLESSLEQGHHPSKVLSSVLVSNQDFTENTSNFCNSSAFVINTSDREIQVYDYKEIQYRERPGPIQKLQDLLNPLEEVLILWRCIVHLHWKSSSTSGNVKTVHPKIRSDEEQLDEE